MEKLKLLDLKHCSTNEEVAKEIRKRVLTVSVEELIKELSNNFVYHEDAVKTVYAALAMNNNAILYGPGGYAKSEIVKAICNVLNIPLICKIGYQDMSPEELFGIPNIKNMLENSKYETAFENSVFCIPGVLCIEEGMDLSPQTAAALKDILTEKGFREGSIKKESLISSVIITGNKEPEDESINDSIKAFYIERFPYRYNMHWNSHLETNYLKLFSVVYNTEVYQDNFKKLLLVGKICESVSNKNINVSPRLAIYASELAINLGVSFLSTISAFKGSFLSSSLQKMEDEDKLENEIKFLEKIEQVIISIGEEIKTSLDIKELGDKYSILKGVESKIGSYTFSDNAFTHVSSIVNKINDNLKVIDNKLASDHSKIDKYINKLFS
jgi:hypothetical protein